MIHSGIRLGSTAGLTGMQYICAIGLWSAQPVPLTARCLFFLGKKTPFHNSGVEKRNVNGSYLTSAHTGRVNGEFLVELTIVFMMPAHFHWRFSVLIILIL